MSLRTSHNRTVHLCYQKQHMVASAVFQGEPVRESVGKAKKKKSEREHNKLMRAMTLCGMSSEYQP